MLLKAFGAIRQAIQRAPYSPEAHNLHGLLCEVRSDYQSAITAYQQARCALHMEHNSVADFKSHITDVSVNLARSLIKVEYLWVIELITFCDPFFFKEAH